MILSPYHNPPYRNPTASGSSGASRSPTRPQQTLRAQREDSVSSSSGQSTHAYRNVLMLTASADVANPLSTMTAAAQEDTRMATSPQLQLDTNPQSPVLAQQHLHLESGANSPRSKVAERLRELDLHQWRAGSPVWPSGHVTKSVSPSPQKPGSSTSSTSFSPRKRLKRTSDQRDDDATKDEVSTFTLGPAASSSPPAKSSEQGDSITVAQPSQKRQLASPSPSADLDPDRAALTWKESEITGHDIDPFSPDDDGEGINGIGFRPTPAMEQQRRQKRRQQVSEWKAREAREARQRRFERRKRSTGGSDPPQGSDSPSPSKRMVRFE